MVVQVYAYYSLLRCAGGTELTNNKNIALAAIFCGLLLLLIISTGHRKIMF